MITSSVLSSATITIEIAPAETLVLTSSDAASMGDAWIYELAAGTAAIDTASVAANDMTVIGPYATGKRIAITPTSGRIDYSYGIVDAVTLGPSSTRPRVAAGRTQVFFDVTLGKLLYWQRPHWYDAAGAQVADFSMGTVPPVAPQIGNAAISQSSNSALIGALAA